MYQFHNIYLVYIYISWVSLLFALPSRGSLNGMGWDEMGRNEMEWNGVGWNGMGWNGTE